MPLIVSLSFFILSPSLFFSLSLFLSLLYSISLTLHTFLMLILSFVTGLPIMVAGDRFGDLSILCVLTARISALETLRDAFRNVVKVVWRRVGDFLWSDFNILIYTRPLQQERKQQLQNFACICLYDIYSCRHVREMELITHIMFSFLFPFSLVSLLHAPFTSDGRARHCDESCPRQDYGRRSAGVQATYGRHCCRPLWSARAFPKLPQGLSLSLSLCPFLFRSLTLCPHINIDIYMLSCL